MTMGTLRVEIEGENLDVQKTVDADISAFDNAFQQLGNDRLVRGEKAIIKTYLAWKLGLMKSGS